MDEARKIAGGFGLITNAINTIKEDRSDKQYGQYLNILQNAESMDSAHPPEGADVKMWNKAVVDHIGKELAEGQLKDQRFELLKNEMSTKRSMIMENARRAESLVPTSADSALDAYMESYSAHPNGVSAKKNQETNMWDFEDAVTGNKWSEAVTLDDARQMTQALLATGEYEKMYLTDRSRVTNFNKIGMLNPDIMENTNGDQVSIFTMIDPNTGAKNLKVLGSDGKMADLDPEELLHGGYKMVHDSQKDRLDALGIKKAELQVERQEQQMRHADESMGLKRDAANRGGAGGVGMKTGKLSPKEEIMQAYGVGEAEAMDIIRSDKSLGQRLGLAKSEIKESLLDPQSPKDAAAINEILKRHNVDKLPGHEGYGRETNATGGQAPKQQEGLPGRFVPPAGAKQAQQSGNVQEILSRLEQAFPGAPDGTVKYKGTQKFIKQQGQWVPEQ